MPQPKPKPEPVVTPVEEEPKKWMGIDIPEWWPFGQETNKSPLALKSTNHHFEHPGMMGTTTKDLDDEIDFDDETLF